jgi:hypothetical protein
MVTPESPANRMYGPPLCRRTRHTKHERCARFQRTSVRFVVQAWFFRSTILLIDAMLFASDWIVKQPRVHVASMNFK